MKKILFNIYWLLLLFSVSCKKLVEVPPPVTSTNGDNVFNENSTAIAALTGIYTNMAIAPVASTTGWLTNVPFTTGLTGDELILYRTTDEGYNQYFQNSISPLEFTWQNIYKIIFIANSAIEKLPLGTSLDEAVRSQLLGEAKFLRAFCYFYLVNLYGDVPLAISSDYERNRVLPRAEVQMVYDQIITDLKDAQELMSPDFVGRDGMTASVERTRPNKWTATALLARSYLYRGDYAHAEIEATSLIDNNSLFTLVGINEAFLKDNNQEAIWQLQSLGLPENNEANTPEGRLFNLAVLPAADDYIVYLRDEFVQGFDDNDLRKSNWISAITQNGTMYYFPYKYKLGRESAETSEYSTVFRLAEQYLIRAEARIQQGKIAEGIQDLNVLRTRATAELPAAQLAQLPTDLDKKNALVVLEDERKFELFTEWGHRWFDLKRMPDFDNPSTSRADVLLSAIKGNNWQRTDQLFPLPQADIDRNPNMRGEQNAGY